MLRTLLRRLLPAPIRGPLARLFQAARLLHPERRRRERAFHAANAGAAGHEMTLRPGLTLAVDPRARHGFEHFCFRSLEMARELDAFLAERGSRLCLLDVGALHGLFALAFTHGRPQAHALAVEPSPVALEVLESNLRLNPGCRIEPQPVALGARPGLLRMQPCWHHLEALPEGTTVEGAVDVPLTTVDLLCSERGFSPDLVKIDVEGYELEVLEGARETLARCRPVLFLEVHPDRLAALGHPVAEVVDLLDRLGYELFRAEGGRSAARWLATVDRVVRVIGRPLGGEPGGASAAGSRPAAAPAR